MDVMYADGGPMMTETAALDEADGVSLPELLYREALDEPEERRRRGFQDLPAARLIKAALSKGHAISRCTTCNGTVLWSKDAGPAGRYGVCVTCRSEHGRLPRQGQSVSRCPSCARSVAFGSRVICLACGFDNTKGLDSFPAAVAPVVLIRQLRDRTCRAPRCGRRFVPRRGKARYCSTACRVRAHRATGRVTIRQPQTVA
jgi:hypothetical protein